MTDVNTTAVGLEVADAGDPAAAATAVVVEVSNPGDPAARASLAVAEAVNIGDPSARATEIVAEAVNIGEPAARATVIGLEVWRSIRESPYPNFPVRLFCPPTFSARLEGGGVEGAVSLSNEQAIGAMTAGARWTCQFSQTPLWTADMVKTWRMFLAACDGGTMPCIVPVWDRRHQPYASPELHVPTTFGQVVWRDFHEWTADEVQAETTVTAEKFATEITFTFAGGVGPDGGEHFSVYLARYGWHLYRLIRKLDEADGAQTWEIRPPLREWMRFRTPLNFDSPRCTMRPEGDISEVVERLRFGKGAATFVESFSRYP